jgi:predicted transcriptional regulator
LLTSGEALVATTTIRIDEDLKVRVAAAAQRAGKTAHAFVPDAITSTVEQDETDEAFHRVADERWTKVLGTGQTVAWEEAKTWIEARSRGEYPPLPAPRKPGR